MRKNSSSDDFISTGFFVLIVLIGVVLYQKWTNARENKEFATTNTSLQTALSKVCTGIGVPEASAYDSKASFHSIMILSATGEFHDWSKNIPVEWLPQDISSAELVACLGNEEEVQIGSECEYIGGSSMTRVQFKLPIEIRSVRTGEVILAETFKGSTPDPCPQTANVADRKVLGSHVSYDDVENWLTQFIVDETKRPYIVDNFSPELEGKATSGQTIISPGTVQDLALSPDGTLLVTSMSGANKNDLSVWDTTTLSHLATLLENPLLHTDAYAVAFSPDGKTFASGAQTVIIWDAATFTQKKVLEIEDDATVQSLAFSQNKSFLVVGLSNGHAIVWDIESYERKLTLQGIASRLNRVAFSPDGEIVAFGSGKEVILWNTTTGEKLANYVQDDILGDVASIAFSPDGETFAYATWAGKIYLAEIDTGKLRTTLDIGEDDIQVDIAFYPDETTLLSTFHSELIVWDAVAGKQLVTMHGGSGRIAYATNQISFVTGNETIVFWTFGN